MSTISFSQINDGTTGTASQVNTPLNTIYDEFNGNISSVNLADGAVTTDKLADGAATPDKTDFGADADTVDTAETTSTSTNADLATTGPSVTVTVPSSGKVWLSWGANMTNTDSADGRVSMGVHMSGSNTLTDFTSDNRFFFNAYNTPTSAGSASVQGKSLLITGLTSGSTTFTCKYGTNTNGSFSNRYISAIPIG